MDIEKVKSEIAKQLDLVLEEGVQYFANYIDTEYGTTGGTLFCLIDNKQNYEICAVQNDALDVISVDGTSGALFALTSTFPAYSKIRYTFQKGKPMMAEVCTPTMLLEDMLQEISETSFLKIEEHINFLNSGKIELDVESVRTKKDQTILEVPRSIVKDDVTCLYAALNKQIKKIHLQYESGSLKMSSIPAFPEWNIPLYTEPEVQYELDENNLRDIYAFLESMNDKKFSMALEALAKNPEFKTQAEKRYLNLIRVRLKDPKAGLDKLNQLNVINKTNVATMLGKYLDKDFISFSYMNDPETVFIVDYLGSMVRNAFDRKAYYVKASACKNESELMECYRKHADKVKRCIKQEVEEYEDGWFGKINDKLFSMRLSKLMFEKTKYKEANKSEVLDEFMFFLNIHDPGGLYVDVCQSDTPAFSKMFWLLYYVPQTNWVDVNPVFPESILTFERKGKYRIGDSGKWKTLSSVK